MIYYSILCCISLSVIVVWYTVYHYRIVMHYIRVCRVYRYMYMFIVSICLYLCESSGELAMLAWRSSRLTNVLLVEQFFPDHFKHTFFKLWQLNTGASSERVIIVPYKVQSDTYCIWHVWFPHTHTTTRSLWTFLVMNASSSWSFRLCGKPMKSNAFLAIKPLTLWLLEMSSLLASLC